MCFIINQLFDIIHNNHMTTFGQIGFYNLNQCISSIDISPLGDYFAAGTIDQILYVWNAHFEPLDKNPIIQKDGHLMGIVDIKFNNKGTSIAVSSLDSVIRNWQVLTGQLIQIECQPLENYKIDFIDRTIVTAGELGKLAFFDSISTQKTQELRTEEVFSTALTISSNQSYIGVGNNNGTVFIFNRKNNNKMGKYQLHHKMIRSLAFTENQAKLITASEDQTIKIFDVANQKVITQLNGHKQGITAIDTHPVDQRILLSTSLDKSIKLWDIRTKNSTGNIQYHNNAVWDAKFNNNGKIIFSGGQSGILAVHSYK